jgi:hypothetical protein
MKFGTRGTLLEFSVNGYEYRIYQAVEDDCIKNYHLAFFDGIELDVPALREVSPYEYLSIEEFYDIILDAQWAAAQCQLDVGCEFD